MNQCGILRIFAVLLGLTFLNGCVTTPPTQVNNICSIFKEKRGWYEDAKKSRARWGVPISVLMATMHQESRFVATAKPPRKKLWGVLPGQRASNAYGYSQALDSTWAWYQKSTGNYGADRDNFGDAVDFIGWYHNYSYGELKLPREDAFKLYLAYHEGHGGFKRQTYRDKSWLIDVARKVDKRALEFNTQLNSCQEELEPRGWLDKW